MYNMSELSGLSVHRREMDAVASVSHYYIHKKRIIKPLPSSLGRGCLRYHLTQYYKQVKSISLS